MLKLQESIADLLLELERQIGDPSQLEVVLDLSETPIITSNFVNELIRINLRLRMDERRLLLINVQPLLSEMLKLWRLDRTFDYEPTPVCAENGQASPSNRQQSGATLKTPSIFLQKFTSRFVARSDR